MCAGLWVTPGLWAAGGEEARKQELQRLKQQAAQKQEELKKYRAQEQAISKEMAALESRKAEAQRQKNKLESDINYVEQTILSTEDKRAALERSLPMWRGVLAEELQQYYLMPKCAFCPGETLPEEELLLERALTHKAEFAECAGTSILAIEDCFCAVCPAFLAAASALACLRAASALRWRSNLANKSSKARADLLSSLISLRISSALRLVSLRSCCFFKKFVVMTCWRCSIWLLWAMSFLFLFSKS